MQSTFLIAIKETTYLYRFETNTIETLYSLETQRKRQRHRQREKQDPCREPHVGINPRTLGPRPEPKAVAQPLSHPGIPLKEFLYGKVDLQDPMGWAKVAFCP